MNKKMFISIIGVSFLAVAIIGTTFAYFFVSVNGNSGVVAANGNCRSEYYDSDTGYCRSPYYQSNIAVLQGFFEDYYEYVCSDDDFAVRCCFGTVNAISTYDGLAAIVNINQECPADLTTVGQGSTPPNFGCMISGADLDGGAYCIE